MDKNKKKTSQMLNKRRAMAALKHKHYNYSHEREQYCIRNQEQLREMIQDNELRQRCR